MSCYITILATRIHTPADLLHIVNVIKGIHEIESWSVDLEDCDNILRIVSSREVGTEIIERLACYGGHAEVMEVFDQVA